MCNIQLIMEFHGSTIWDKNVTNSLGEQILDHSLMKVSPRILDIGFYYSGNSNNINILLHR